MIEIQLLLKKYSDSSVALQRSFEDLKNYKKQQETPDFDPRLLFLLYAKYLKNRKDFKQIESEYQCLNSQVKNTTMY